MGGSDGLPETICVIGQAVVTNIDVIRLDMALIAKVPRTQAGGKRQVEGVRV